MNKTYNRIAISAITIRPSDLPPGHIICPRCSGSGTASFGAKCLKCNGKGYVKI